MELVGRHLQTQIEETLRWSRVVMLHGALQSGKTTLAKMIADSRDGTYVSMDDEELRETVLSDPLTFLAHQRCPRGGCKMGNAQVETNHKVYNEKYRHEMERDHSGRIALMHDGVVAGIFDDDNSAYWDGCKKYGLGNFSLEWIGAEPVRLGSITAALQ